MPMPQYSYDVYEPPEPYEFESELQDPLISVLLENIKGKLSPEEEYQLQKDLESTQRGIMTRAGRIGALPAETTMRALSEAEMNLPIMRQLLETEKQTSAIGDILNTLGFQGSQQQFGYQMGQQAGQYGFGQEQQAEQYYYDKIFQDYWNRKQIQFAREQREAEANKGGGDIWGSVLGGLGTGIGLAINPIEGLVGLAGKGISSLFSSPSSSYASPSMSSNLNLSAYNDILGFNQTGQQLYPGYKGRSLTGY